LAPFLENSKTPRDCGLSSPSFGGISIRVYLLRHVVLKAFEDQKTASTQVLGEAKLRYSDPLPENHHSYRNHPLREGTDCLDWDGELRCGEDVTVASFSTSTLTVRVRLELHYSYDFPFNDVLQDYIVLSLDPLEPMKCPLIATKQSHPIRLVTDPWSDRALTW